LNQSNWDYIYLSMNFASLQYLEKVNNFLKKKLESGQIWQIWAGPPGRRPTSPRHARERRFKPADRRARVVSGGGGRTGTGFPGPSD
jgi:hypothetical protein